MVFGTIDLLERLADGFNVIEIFLWPAMGLTLLIASRRRSGPARRDFWLAGLVLLVFGPSDYAELESGGRWWSPWWLFAWKASCVAGLMAILVVAARRTKRLAKASHQLTTPEAVSPGTAHPEWPSRPD